MQSNEGNFPHKELKPSSKIYMHTCLLVSTHMIAEVFHSGKTLENEYMCYVYKNLNME